MPTIEQALSPTTENIPRLLAQVQDYECESNLRHGIVERLRELVMHDLRAAPPLLEQGQSAPYLDTAPRGSRLAALPLYAVSALRLAQMLDWLDGGSLGLHRFLHRRSQVIALFI